MDYKEQFNEAMQFLNTLAQDNPNEIFHFQTFDDQKEHKRTYLNRVLIGTLQKHFDELIKLNNQGAGVFVCVNKIPEGLRREGKNVTSVRAIFADKDDGNFDQFPITPSIVVQTKNGQHAYWVTNEVSCNEFTSIQKAVINKLKTDISIHDLPRVMRLPGFYHRKNPNDIFMVKLLENNKNMYSYTELLGAFPKTYEVKKSIESVKGTHAEVSRFIEKIDGAIEGEAGDNKTFQVACHLVRGFNLSNEDALVYFKEYNKRCVPPWPESELIKKLESARKSGSGEFGELLKNVTTEQWVYKFIEKNNIKTSYNQKVSFNGEIISISALIRKAEIQWDSENRKSKGNIIKYVFEEWEEKSKKDILARTKKIFEFKDRGLKDKNNDELSKFTEALVGKKCNMFLQHRAVLEHFVWQVKRKLFGLPVVHHMCPILVGAQGSGKTVAIENLISPLKHLSMEGNLGTFVRESERFVFGTYYIVKLDEFAKGTKADLESMKNVMTSADVNFRTFYTQKMAYMPNVSTFIGASNRSVAEIFNDQTGNRRFYEIPCLKKVDWEIIGGLTEDEGLDYCNIWQSVDENSESPILPFIDDINNYQEESRSKSLVEQWLDYEALVPNTEDFVKIEPVKKLHLDFMNWLKLQNCNYMYTAAIFGKELSRHLKNRKRNDGSYYEIKDKNFKSSGLNKKKITSDTSEEELEKFLDEALNTEVVLFKK